MFEMIEGIARASRDQASSTRYLNEETERVRDVAVQLKGATDEQARGTAVISDAMGHILEDSRHTTRSVESQATESSAIFDAMRQVALSALAIEGAFSKLSQTAELLRRSADVLGAEIRNFRTGA